MTRLVALYRDALTHRQRGDTRNSDDAELGAWTAVASVLLNLDEVLTKG